MSDLTELLKSIEKDRKYMIGSGGLYGCNDVWLLVDRIEELESKEIALQKAIAETVVQLDNSQLSLIHADEQITELQAVVDRIASGKQINKHGDCGGDKALWCANEVIAIVEYAKQHATEKEECL